MNDRNALQLARVIVAIAWLALVGGIVWAGSQASLASGMSDLLDDPWGIVTLIDIYVGGVVVAVWIFYREPHLWTALLWVIAFLGLGHLITATYFLYRSAFATTLTEVFFAQPIRHQPEENPPAP